MEKDKEFNLSEKRIWGRIANRRSALPVYREKNIKEFNLSEDRTRYDDLDNISGDFVYNEDKVEEFIKRDALLIALVMDGTLTWGEFWVKRAKLIGKNFI